MVNDKIKNFAGTNMRSICVLFLIIPIINSLPTFRKKQSVAVKGILLCNGQPMENVKVKLYDVDRMIFY